MCKEHFKKVICVKSYMDGFKEGDIYARIGDNNGVHVFCIDKIGNPVDVTCHNYTDGLHAVDDYDTVFKEIESTFHE